MAPPAPTISRRELSRATLARQGLLEPVRAASTAEAVERVGSLQAQHPDWPPIALAARIADPATADLAAALNRREVVRSSLMRTTIHVVSAGDLWPMFAVCRPMRATQWRLLTGHDPLDSPLGRRMMAAHATALAALAGEPLSSLALDRLMAAEVGPVESPVQRIYWRHLAAFVPLVHVPHDGEGYGRSRYAIAADWLGVAAPSLDPAEARAHVTRRYLAAFGPASMDDLVAYVGRGRGGVGPWREALASLGTELITMVGEDGRNLHDLADAPRPGPDVDAPPRLLARWDSLLLSHAPKHRDRVISAEHRATVFSRNADVLPTFLVDGFVAGTWEMAREDGTARIRLRPFGRLARGDRRGLGTEAERLLELVAPNGSHSVQVE